MNMSNEEIQAVVAATLAAMGNLNQGNTAPEMPISNQQHFGRMIIPAQSEKHVPFLGSYVAIFSNTASKDVMVSMDNGLANYIKAGTGYPCVRLSRDKTTYEPAVYRRVTFQNFSDEDMTIEYVLSLGPVTDTRAVVEGWLQVDLSAPSLETPEAVAVGMVAPVILTANALIKERLVINTGEFPIWWGDSTINPALKRGLPIYPGGSAAINCRGAVYLLAEDGDSTLSINYTKKG